MENKNIMMFSNNSNKKNEQPKVKINLSLFDKILEIVGLVLLISYWFIIINSYSNLPDNVPTHFNGAGQPDGYGSKLSIFGLPVIGLFAFVLLTIFNKYPEKFTYSVQITDDNAKTQYILATRRNRIIKTIILILFIIIDFRTIEIAVGDSISLGSWFFYLFSAYFLFQLFSM
ncbi:DUF1648 domain-containing protein [Chryseobacterium sp. 1B4]